MELGAISTELSATDYTQLNMLTDSEKAIVIRSGLMCLHTTKKLMVETTEKDIYASVQAEFACRIQELEKDKRDAEESLSTEKTLYARILEEKNKDMNSRIDEIIKHKVNVYDKLSGETQRESQRLSDMIQMKNKEIYELKEQIRNAGMDFDTRLAKTVNEKMEAERDAREKQFADILSKNTTFLETAIQSSNVKTSSEIGVLGEQRFYDIAKATFMDFEGFEIHDVHNQPHKGDFHVSAKGITIMVDAKAYKRNVDSSQIEKIKSDLKRNSHIHFAWLVSLNTNIDRRDNALFLFEWIAEDQCIVHINNLLALDNKEMLLKTVFHECHGHYKRIQNSNIGHAELLSIRDNHKRVAEKVDVLKKRLKEVKTSLNGLKNLHDELEKDVLNILNEESNGVVNKFYGDVIEWWSKHITTKEGGKIKSTAIWTVFKKENDEMCKHLDVAGFKDILCVIVPQDKIVKAKGKAGAMDILDVDWIPQDTLVNSSVAPVLKIDTPVVKPCV